MKSVLLNLPADLVYQLRLKPNQTSIDDMIKLPLAIGLFATREISLAKAAELCGKNITEFKDLLISYEIPLSLETQSE